MGILDIADRVERIAVLDTREAVDLRNAIHNLLPEPKCVQPPDYLRSLDAAMSLHPSEPWLVSMMHETGHAGGWRVEFSSLADGAVAISDAGCDAARAFTAASLRAMAGGDDGEV